MFALDLITISQFCIIELIKIIFQKRVPQNFLLILSTILAVISSRAFKIHCNKYKTDTPVPSQDQEEIVRWSVCTCVCYNINYYEDNYLTLVITVSSINGALIAHLTVVLKPWPFYLYLPACIDDKQWIFKYLFAVIKLDDCHVNVWLHFPNANKIRKYSAFQFTTMNVNPDCLLLGSAWKNQDILRSIYSFRLFSQLQRSMIN